MGTMMCSDGLRDEIEMLIHVISISPSFHYCIT